MSDFGKDLLAAMEEVRAHVEGRPSGVTIREIWRWRRKLAGFRYWLVRVERRRLWRLTSKVVPSVIETAPLAPRVALYAYRGFRASIAPDF